MRRTHMAHIPIHTVLLVSVTLHLCFCFVCLHVYVLSGQINVCVIDYIRAAISFFPSEQFRDDGAMNSDCNVKHQGEVIIKIYATTEL